MVVNANRIRCLLAITLVYLWTPSFTLGHEAPGGGRPKNVISWSWGSNERELLENSAGRVSVGYDEMGRTINGKRVRWYFTYSWNGVTLGRGPKGLEKILEKMGELAHGSQVTLKMAKSVETDGDRALAPPFDTGNPWGIFDGERIPIFEDSDTYRRFRIAVRKRGLTVHLIWPKLKHMKVADLPGGSIEAGVKNP